METRAFAPLYGPDAAPAQAGTGQGTTFPSTTVVAGVAAVASTRFSGTGHNGACQIRVANKTSAWAHINFGNLDIGAVTAATVAASLAVAPGSVEVFSVDPEVNGASVILDAAPTGSTSVIFTRGEGV